MCSSNLQGGGQGTHNDDGSLEYSDSFRKDYRQRGLTREGELPAERTPLRSSNDLCKRAGISAEKHVTKRLITDEASYYVYATLVYPYTREVCTLLSGKRISFLLLLLMIACHSA
jgi:hypothetical protein